MSQYQQQPLVLPHTKAIIFSENFSRLTVMWRQSSEINLKTGCSFFLVEMDKIQIVPLGWKENHENI